jgi:hypothetical protein
MEPLNKEYFKIKLEVLLSELNESLEKHSMGDSRDALASLRKIVRKHTITLAKCGDPAILKQVPENLH